MSVPVEIKGKVVIFNTTDKFVCKKTKEKWSVDRIDKGDAATYIWITNDSGELKAYGAAALLAYYTKEEGEQDE